MAWKHSPGGKLEVHRDYLIRFLSLRDGSSLFCSPWGLGFESCFTYLVFPLSLVIASGRENPILISLTWPLAEVSHNFSEVIMNSMKPEENKSFTATENGQSSRPEDSKVCLLFSNSWLERHTLTIVALGSWKGISS